MPKAGPPAKGKPGDEPAKGKPVVGLFAKPPRPGAVKTRLVPPLTPPEAAALYAAFLADLAALLAGDGGWDWIVYSTDSDAQREHWPEGAPLPRDFRTQQGADLGERMEAALAELLAEGYSAALLLGSDHPSVPRTVISQAFRALENADLVLGPSRDGGYYLVGMSAPLPGLFDGIPWSTPLVLERTRTRAREKGWRLASLPAWYDVDTIEDLRHLRSHLSDMRRAEIDAPPCPRTWEALCRLDRERLSGP